MSRQSLKRKMNSNLRFFLALVFKGSDPKSHAEFLLEGRERFRRLIVDRKGVNIRLSTIDDKKYEKKSEKPMNLQFHKSPPYASLLFIE